MTKQFQKKYLLITSIAIGSFGPIFFLGSMLETSELARWSLDFLSFPLDGNMTFESPTTRFLSALTGGFLLGWGITVYCLSLWVYDKAPEGCRKSILVGIFAWFIADSAGSILSGNGINVLFNILIAIVAIGPLWKKAEN
jgi:hypothetical protein